MSENKLLKEVSVKQILETYNLIVPEIQREYVWGQNQYGVFQTFLDDIQEGLTNVADETDEERTLKDAILNPAIDEQTKKALKEILDKLVKPIATMNIGFLYSYKPGYYIGNDREEDLYLIDGQQRFTTLVLILFYFAIKEDKKADFISLFKFDAAKEKIAFDYRVRSITHQFFIELIEKCNTINDLLEIRNKNWFLSSYANDTTVKSIAGMNENTGVFYLLHNFFQNDISKYYDFVKTGIKFWHFKAEETTQGEELYITMNSRGQQLADNENIRAKLFDDELIKNNSLFWSEKWEQWQDFFWKNRDKSRLNSSADDGFNEFLRWVQLLKMYESYNQQVPITDDLRNKFEKALQWGTEAKLESEYFSLIDIDQVFESLKCLYGAFESDSINLKNIYPKSFSGSLIPKKWIANEGRVLGLIDLFQLLPVLAYIKKHIVTDKEIKNIALYRLIRCFRFLSRDVTIGKAVRQQVANALFFSDELTFNMDLVDLANNQKISTTILNEELNMKLSLLNSSSERETLEDLFWYAEELLETEILHLITLTIEQKGIFDIEYFEKVVLCYQELLDNEDDVTFNLMHTDFYSDQYDRIYCDKDWYKKSGLMNLLVNRIENNQINFNDFLVQQQKIFIGGYETEQEIIEEDSAGNQLFIYYILATNDIYSNKIGWNFNYFNFGKLAGYSGFHTIFKNGIIYQGYDSAFRQNPIKILGTHSLKDKLAVKKLLAWATEPVTTD